MKRCALPATLVVALLLMLAPLARAQPTFFFARECLVEGGIQLTFTASEDIAAGRLQWLLSDGQQVAVGAVAANTPHSEATTSQGGTSILLLDGDEVGRVFTELEHIQECERPIVLRLAGPTRFDTAVAISQARFQGTADTVYLATGQNFADALAGSPLAFDGPVLLVQTDVLPDVVRDEITRLEPDHLVVFGGSAAVSDAVLQAARDAAGLR